jgi:hypothetical protein
MCGILKPGAGTARSSRLSSFFPFAGKMSRVPLEVDVNGEELFVVDDKVLLLLLPSCLLVLASFKTCLLFFLLRFRHGPRPLLVSEL